MSAEGPMKLTDRSRRSPGAENARIAAGEIIEIRERRARHAG
jgi:hypothetical protein